MIKIHSIKVILFLFIASNLVPAGKSYFFPYVYPRIKLEAKYNSNAGDPLILTPYLKKDLELARNLSKVSFTEKIGFTSYAGFFTVNEKYNSNLYFWYFPPFLKRKNSPFILWLQGGPGASSLFGLFTENGPLVAEDNAFGLRKHHWAINNHLIFIDNPVGTGFSFTDDDKGYCTDEKCVAVGLYNCLQQFFTMFPDLRKNEFYISGESYAGKYIPSLAMEIHQENSNGNNDKINLQGLALGNAYCDPINQMDYGSYLYQHGLIDHNQQDIFQQMQAKIAAAIKKEDWAQADILMDKLMDGDFTNSSYFKNYTGFDDYYNFLLPKSDINMSVFTSLIHNDKVRKSIHVGGLPFNSGTAVQIHLAYDMLKTVAPYFTELLSNYRVIVYNGQLDIIVAYPLTEKFLCNLQFNGADEYKTAPRHIWRVGNDIAGYYKKASNLTEVLVRNAGHMVPHDQPKWAFDLITRFIRNTFKG